MTSALLPETATPSRPDRRTPNDGFWLLRWFSIVSFLAIAVVSAGMALVLARFVETQLLQHDAELSRQFVQGIVDTQQVTAFFKQGEASGNKDGFAEFFGHVAAMPDVLRANVYAPDGHVLWSSDPALIGQRFDDNDELERAIRGTVVIERGTVGDEDEEEHHKAEHVALARTDESFVENYLPVFDHTGPPGALIGVVELYRVPRSLNATLRSGTLLVWSCALIAGLVLYLSMLGLVCKTSRLMQRQQVRLVEAEANALVGEMAASVAHSIRNPLASIRSSAELQQELGSAPADVAQQTVRDVDRIEHLVRTLLTYVRDPNEAQGSADVAATLDGAMQRFAPVFRAQRKPLDLRLEAGLPSVHGDSVLLTQVVNSLLANALEATASGDRVVVSARRAGPEVEIDVCDTGPGIAAERLPHLFKPFQTTKPQGLGMGLALARRTLERVGGRIELHSRPGQTRAVLHLRVAGPAAQPG